MATYYASSNDQRDVVPMIYMPGSYPEGQVIPGNLMMYMNNGSYSDNLGRNSQQHGNCVEIQSLEASDSTPHQQEMSSFGRNEMLIMHSVDGPSSIFHSGPNLQGQGLSLSLGTQIPQSKNAEFIQPGFSGGNRDSNEGDLSQYGVESAVRTFQSSKYLKAAQKLLDEVVNGRKALKQPDKEKNRIVEENNGSKEDGNQSKNVTSNPREGTDNLLNELSNGERQELQNKLTKLLSMLDEVDKRYRQYYHQMQAVVSSFDVIVGYGAAKPYTALALQTMSRHFRCLRDAISGQIQSTRKSLGEQETSKNGIGVGITRLRYVDQQLRQQRALQQLGMMQQHSWRPQRGLPESSVSILRAWLFEHFLHPYPKDSDKIMLARQTGLTRSQVSNWFINARVRLWKPMVEEMYKEEIGDVEFDSISSSENAAKPSKGDTRTSEEMQQTSSSTANERPFAGPLMDSKSNHVHDIDITGSEYRLREKHRPSMDNSGLFSDTIAYHILDESMFGGRTGSGVSLTLGLQHCEGGNLSMSATNHHSFISMRGDDMYGSVGSSVGTETTDFECLNPGNREHRFSNSHLLHDFVP